METTRGCPFACTFCQQGEAYYNKVRRFSKYWHREIKVGYIKKIIFYKEM